jgi:hypothetical protein
VRNLSVNEMTAWLWSETASWLVVESFSAFLGAPLTLGAAIWFFHHQRKRERQDAVAEAEQRRKTVLTGLASEIFTDASMLHLMPRPILQAEAKAKATGENPRFDFYIPSAISVMAYQSAMRSAEPRLISLLLKCHDLHRGYSSLPIFQEAERAASSHTVRGKEGAEIGYRILKASEKAATTTQEMLWKSLAWLQSEHKIHAPGIDVTRFSPSVIEERVDKVAAAKGGS